MDFNRVVKATHQALELRFPDAKKSRYPDFYSPSVSSAEWDWSGKGGFCPVTGKAGADYVDHVDPKVIERGFPRRVQGEIMSFHYNDMATSSRSGRELDWAGIRPSLDENDFFGKDKFFFMIWRGRNSEAPTEIYLPRHFDLDSILVITHAGIFNALPSPATQAPEIPRMDFLFYLTLKILKQVAIDFFYLMTQLRKRRSKVSIDLSLLLN